MIKNIDYGSKYRDRNPTQAASVQLGRLDRVEKRSNYFFLAFSTSSLVDAMLAVENTFT